MKFLRTSAAQATIANGSSVVVWDRSNYFNEASRPLHSKNTYADVKFRENILTGLVEKRL